MTHEEMWAAGALTVDEASAFAGLSRATLYRLVRDKKLISHVAAGRRLFARTSLVEFISDSDERRRALAEAASNQQPGEEP